MKSSRLVLSAGLVLSMAVGAFACGSSSSSSSPAANDGGARPDAGGGTVTSGNGGSGGTGDSGASTVGWTLTGSINASSTQDDCAAVVIAPPDDSGANGTTQVIIKCYTEDNETNIQLILSLTTAYPPATGTYSLAMTYMNLNSFFISEEDGGLVGNDADGGGVAAATLVLTKVNAGLSSAGNTTNNTLSGSVTSDFQLSSGQTEQFAASFTGLP